MNRVSKLFQPIHAIPKNATLSNADITSKSQRLMLDLGVIKLSSPGNFHFLPLGVKALEKLIGLVDREMKAINGQKVILPTLTSSKLWEKTGRIRDAASELFKLQDRHNNAYLLSPTHEEAVTDLLASLSPLSYKHFPLRLYQITSKYRDEMKPRFGLMRSRQFIMKDLYTFDIDIDKARDTYQTVCDVYDTIFNKIGVNFMKVLGATGNIGGSLSHEYHYTTDVGEDKIFICGSCSYSGNVEISGTEECRQCGSAKEICIKNGIEVGHTFLLGDKYSKPLEATCLAMSGKPVTLQMGCFGLGLSRIVAAAVEVLSLEHEIRWPFILAPYKLIIIPPKAGSKEEPATLGLSETLYQAVEALPTFKDNVLLDDRTHLTIGKRFFESKRVGYPYIIVVGSKAAQNLFELNDLSTNSQYYLSETELLHYLNETNCVKLEQSTTINA